MDTYTNLKQKPARTRTQVLSMVSGECRQRYTVIEKKNLQPNTTIEYLKKDLASTESPGPVIMLQRTNRGTRASGF